MPDTGTGTGIQVSDGVAPPTGSVTSDLSTSIPVGLLNYLSNSAKSALLSVANIGASTFSKIIKILEVVDSLSGLETYLMDGTKLDGLANNATSASFGFPNQGTSRLYRVVINFGEITPIAGAKVQLTDGTTIYELSVSQAQSEKRLEFNNLLRSFVTSFQVVNKTGVPFAPSGNSVVVVGL